MTNNLGPEHIQIDSDCMCFFARLVPTESHCRCIATASARCLLLNVRQQPGQVPGGNSPHYTSQTVAVEEVVDKSEERIT